VGDYAFDTDSRVWPAGADGEFAAELTDRWNGTAGVPVGSFGLASIAERIEFRSAELPGWFRGQPSGRPASEFWMRFADGREADLLSLLLLVDSTAPSVLELGAGSTTIQLTVHLRAHPAPGWLACRATTRFVSNGYHEEDFEVWDSTGTLVAQSRQLALILAS
jgi:acyl-CoA thioesterase